jgi:two-component system nitrogen regulation sensor histidine kinase NtrY
MGSGEVIRVSTVDMRERKKRRRELWFALAIFIIILVSVFIELKYLGVDSHLFLVVFNVNFILLLLILFLVFRNIVKLVLERKRKVLGAKLRTKLVLSFVTLSLVPTMIMAVVGAKFVQTSADYWFKTQVESSLEKALEVGQSFFAAGRERMKSRSEFVRDRITSGRFVPGGKAMNDFFAEKRAEYGLHLIGFVMPQGEEKSLSMDEGLKSVWPRIKEKVDWDNPTSVGPYWSTIHAGSDGDIIVGVVPVNEGADGWVVLAENVGRDILFKLDGIVRGVDEYKQLRTMKYPIKVALYLILAVVTMLIILAAIWFGFRLAKELSAPVQALAAGTQRIAKGDLSVRLEEDASKDEMGFLVKSFNRMVQDLESGRRRIESANTRLERQNRELEQHGRYIEALLDNITAGVISLDENGRIGTVNKAAEAMLGLDAASLVGKKPLSLLTSTHAELLEEALEKLSESPESQWSRQINLTLGTKELKLFFNVVGLRTGEGQEAGIVAVFEDITELEKMQRLAAWREVARRIAHEIKNPLTPIKLSAQRMERKFAGNVDSPVFSECTELIIRQVEHLQRMVQEFTTFAKLPESRLIRDDLSPLLEEITTLYRNSHGDIEWTLSYENTLPELRMDREGIRRVLMNVMNNAAEALRDAEDKKVDIHASYDKLLGWVRMEVRDSGPGLSAEERSRLFEPYFSRKRGGTGLGLTIVKSIVSDHFGNVHAKPNSPKGTVVVVELPA